MKTMLAAALISAACFAPLTPANAQKLVPCFDERENVKAGKQGQGDLSKPGMAGYCDSATGAMVIPATYTESFPFSHGYAIVNTGKGFRVVDEKNSFVLDKTYEDISLTDVPGLFVVRQKKKMGLMGPGNRVILPMEYDDIEGYAWDPDHYASIAAGSLMTVTKVKGKKSTQGLINAKGEFLVPMSEFLDVHTPGYVSSLPAPQRPEDARYVLTDSSGNATLYDGTGRKLNSIADFYGFWGMNIITVKGGKAGFRRASDLSVIPAPEHLKENFRPMLLNGKWGFMNAKGEMVVPAMYDSYYGFSNATESRTTPVIVKQGAKWGIIDLNNTPRIRFEYDEILPISSANPFGEYFFAVKSGGKYGIINEQGGVIVAPAYDEVRTYGFDGKSFDVRLKKKWGKLGLDGKESF